MSWMAESIWRDVFLISGSRRRELIRAIKPVIVNGRVHLALQTK